MAKISSKVVDDLKQQIDAVTADPDGIPGTVYCAVNKNGDLIFEHASGVVGMGKQEKMTMDSVFWIASCTKMITGIACMQLVEQGKLALDDAEMVEKIAPVSGPIVHRGTEDLSRLLYLGLDLDCCYRMRRTVSRIQRQHEAHHAAGTCKSPGHRRRQVGAEKEKDHIAHAPLPYWYVSISEGIPLLSYIAYTVLTAGFGYSFFDSRLNDFYGQTGLDEFSGNPYDYLSQPLVNQPGEQWEYGINIDWAGQLVERVSGLKLNDYFQKHIFEPMGVKNINMFPTESMKKNLAWMHARTPGKLNP